MSRSQPDEAAIARQGKRLLAMGARAVLIKGGHGQGSESIDYLIRRRRRHRACRAAHRDRKHPRHRLLAVIGDRGGPRQRRDDGSRGSQRQAWITCGDRSRRSFRCRPRPRPDPSFSQILLTVVPAKAGTHTPRPVRRAMGLVAFVGSTSCGDSGIISGDINQRDAPPCLTPCHAVCDRSASSAR